MTLYIENIPQLIIKEIFFLSKIIKYCNHINLDWSKSYNSHKKIFNNSINNINFFYHLR